RLEPWVRVVAEAPEAMHGALVQSLTSRRGRVLDAEPGRVEAEVPLARMFGYATALRSLTSGEGTFGMEFDRFAEVA
ncbi:MAG: elongation factor G, partial [Myxococcota bacterium]